MHREGSEVRQLFQKNGRVAITSKNSKSGAVYLALFNISDEEGQLDINVDLNDLNLGDKNVAVTDLCSGRKVGHFKENFHQKLAKHSCGLYLLK